MNTINNIQILLERIKKNNQIYKDKFKDQLEPLDYKYNTENITVSKLKTLLETINNNTQVYVCDKETQSQYGIQIKNNKIDLTTNKDTITVKQLKELLNRCNLNNTISVQDKLIYNEISDKTQIKKTNKVILNMGRNNEL